MKNWHKMPPRERRRALINAALAECGTVEEIVLAMTVSGEGRAGE